MAILPSAVANAQPQEARDVVLVAENVGASGLDVLKAANFDIDLGYDWSRRQLEERIGDYDAIVIRSATQVDAALIERATKLRAIAPRPAGRGRARRRPLGSQEVQRHRAHGQDARDPRLRPHRPARRTSRE